MDFGESFLKAQKMIQDLQEELEKTNQGMILLTLELETAMEKYKTLFENAIEGIYQCDAEGNFVQVNPAMAKLFGYKTSKEFLQYIPNFNDIKCLIADIQKKKFDLLTSSGEFSEIITQIIIKGKLKWISENAHSISDKNQKLLGYEGSVQDITERKITQDTLKESEERYRIILKTIPIAAILIDNTNTIKEWNEAAERIFGWTREEAISREFFALISNLDNAGSIESELHKALMNHITDTIIFQNIDKKGKKIYCEWINVKFFDSQKVAVGTLLIANDITERRRLEEIITRTQKLDAIGQLTDGIAHDFNNYLNVINGFAEIARTQIDKENPLTEPIDQILNSSKKAGNLIHQLLTFSKRQQITPIQIDINSVIRDLTLLMLQPLIGRSILIENNLGSKIHPILADSIQIEQILVNLCVNARDAINDPSNTNKVKKIMIRTSNICIDSNFVKRSFGETLGNHIIIEISDTGIGMDALTKQRLFEPFFTTKPEGKGTGLGLATVYGIVKQNKASIFVYSEKGQGATFKIYWPAVGNPQVIQETRSLELKLTNKTGTILIADDDPNFRKIMFVSLKTQGFEVIECVDGQDALQKLSDRKFQVDLIITDVNMPKLNGIDLAKSAKKVNNNMKILFISGFDLIIEDSTVIDQKEPNFLVKPFSINDLLAKIQKML